MKSGCIAKRAYYDNEFAKTLVWKQDYDIKL